MRAAVRWPSTRTSFHIRGGQRIRRRFAMAGQAARPTPQSVPLPNILVDCRYETLEPKIPIVAAISTSSAGLTSVSVNCAREIFMLRLQVREEAMSIDTAKMQEYIEKAKIQEVIVRYGDAINTCRPPLAKAPPSNPPRLGGG